MTVAEIEGDAVLFYNDDVPKIADLFEQSRQTFLNFHHHLRRYETERICRCGACRTASSLTLKFIIHKGIVEKIKVKEHEKLHGPDVILAHRLLKNSIEDNEYILFTDGFETDPELKNRWSIDSQKGTDTYDNQNEVGYKYFLLNSLHKDVPDPAITLLPKLKAEKINVKNTINAPIDLIYENFTDLNKRLEWNDDIRDINTHGKNLNKSGSLHTCLIGSDSLDIRSLGREESKNKIIYGERIDQFKGLKDIISIYTFEKIGGKTLVTAEVDYKIKSWLGKLLKPIIKMMLLNQTIKGFMKLKKVSEEHAG
jgi:hypothetical protein